MTTLHHEPDDTGRFGEFGGRYVPETLVAALDELETAWHDAEHDPSFLAELDELLATYVGRPTATTAAPRLTEHAGGAAIWLKREDLAHTGAYKINNTIAQAMLTRRMGKQRLIAETGGWTTWSRHGHGLCTLRSRLHDLHGGRGRSSTGAQRLPHGIARSRRRGRRGRLPDAQGCHQRRDA